jgi:hypothetical protein
MAAVTVEAVEVPTAVEVAASTVVEAAASTAVVATVAVASTVVAMEVEASMEDRPTAVGITAVGIEAECTAAATMEIQALDGRGRLSAEECGTLHQDSIRLPDRETALACRHLAARRWLLLAARARPRDTSHASPTEIFIHSVASTPLACQRTRRSTTLVWWA